MTPEEIKTRLLEIFQSCRAASGTSFEEENFLRFLYDPPIDMGKARNSFKTLRPLNKFLHAIEEDFSIAFTNDEWGKSWSISSLADVIQKKHANPKAQFKFIEKRCLQSGREIYGLPLMVLILILFPVVSLLFKTGVPLWLALGLAALPLGGLTWFNIRHYRHYRAVKASFLKRFPDPRK